MGRPKVIPVPDIPLFDKYSVTELVELLGYKESYLLEIKEGRVAVTPRFRLTASRILRQPESELFTDDPSNPQS